MKAILICLVLFMSPLVDSIQYTTKYDIHFIKWSKYYLPNQHWKLLKAQCIAESNLDPDAVSPVGAQGMCQNMPATWSETERNLEIYGNPFDPRLNIQFSSYYMFKMNKFWSSPRPLVDKQNLAMASYNAGAGNIHKSQKMCTGSILYKDIMFCLECITGHHHVETVNYVERIRRINFKLSLE